MAVSFIFMIGAIASSSSKPSVKEGSILHISLNGNMAEKAAQFDERQKELERLEAQLKAIQTDYDLQLERNKKNKEKISELKQKRFVAEEESRKAQKELRAQLANLSDAKDYIENLSRMVLRPLPSG